MTINITQKLPLEMPAVITADAPPIAPDINTDNRRAMLIEGVKDFDAKMGESAEEIVDRVIQVGRIGSAEAVDESEGATLLLAHQRRTWIKRDADGTLLIGQDNWPDDDAVLMINGDYVAEFLESLTDFLGIGRA